MERKTLATYTLGCKVNQYETRSVEEMFEKKGYEIVDFNDFADVYLINTCTVTSTSGKKSRQIIRRAKQINPNSKVVVIGCYSQNSPDEVAQIEDVNLIMGTTEKRKIVDRVENLDLNKKAILVSDVFEEKEFEKITIDSTNTHTRAFIKIQDGCDRFCSYCIIPYTRGRIRSKIPKDITEEIKTLAQNGTKEVVLTGIHLASYGKDLDNLRLIDIIEEIENIDGIERIRLGSLEPLIIDDEFLKRLKPLKKFCPNFHLSLQSGSNAILKRMNRKYTAEEFSSSVDLIRSYYENPVLTTDIIVGFPMESEEEFSETVKFLEKIKFYQTHIFKFSPREGTKAYDMDGQIDENIKTKRSKVLIDLSEKNKVFYENEMIGKTVKVLFEERYEEFITGHCFNFMKVYTTAEDDSFFGQIKKVLIEKVDGNLGLVGKII